MWNVENDVCGGFPSDSNGKESACNVGDRSNPWVRKVSWRREWQLTPVLLPAESHGQRSPVGYSPWRRTHLRDSHTHIPALQVDSLPSETLSTILFEKEK